MVPEYLNNNEIPVVLPMQYPSQVCRLGMLFHWTRECEQGIGEVRYDRKALQALLKKYTTNTGRLSSILARGSWRTLDEPMLPFHKARLECMITVCCSAPSARACLYRIQNTVFIPLQEVTVAARTEKAPKSHNNKQTKQTNDQKLIITCKITQYKSESINIYYIYILTQHFYSSVLLCCLATFSAV